MVLCKNSYKIFINVRIGKSTSVLLRAPALGSPLGKRCCRLMVRGGRVAGDRVTERISGWPTYVCDAAHFNQWASTLKSCDTGLTLNFGNARLNKDKKTLCTGIFRECRDSGSDVSVCDLEEHQGNRLQYSRLFSVTSIWHIFPVVSIHPDILFDQGRSLEGRVKGNTLKGSVQAVRPIGGVEV